MKPNSTASVHVAVDRVTGERVVLVMIGSVKCDMDAPSALALAGGLVEAVEILNQENAKKGGKN